MVRATVLSLVVVCLLGSSDCQIGTNKQSQVEQMFRDYCATWSTHDIDKMVSYISDDCVYEDLPQGHTYRGKTGVRTYAKASFDAIPDFNLNITSLFVSGDWVGCEWVMNGTPVGGTPDRPATARSFAIRACSIVQLKDGKIFRQSDYWDRSEFLRQVGWVK